MHTQTYNVRDLEKAKNVLTDTLTDLGYRVEWAGLLGTAVLGDLVYTVYARGLETYCCLGLRLLRSKEGAFVRIERVPGGFGGRMGEKRAQRALSHMATELHTALSSADLMRESVSA